MRNPKIVTRQLILLVCLLAFPGSVQAQNPMPDRKRPNIILLLSDDQNAGDLGCAGHPWLQTPHIDSLAKQGMRFRNAFVTSALCSPSRASFLSGRYARHHNVLSNVDPLSAELPTFASELGAAGYSTAYIGKWHMGKGAGPRPGFSYSATYAGHGLVNNCTFLVGYEETERERTKGWVDDVATDYAIDYLRKSRRRPLLLCLGFKSPHTPRRPEPRHAELYADDPLDESPLAQSFPPYPTGPELEALALAADEDPETYSAPEDWLESWKGERIPESQLVRGTGRGEDLRNYYRLLTGMDENIGRLLAVLKELGIDDNTLIVFSSDNGLMNGRLGVFGKRSTYDETLAVPMILRLPPAWEVPHRGSSSDELVLNVDIAPTLLDYARHAPLPGMPGRSLRPLLEGEPTPWRDRFVAEFLPGKGVNFPTILSLRTASWKLNTYPGRSSWTELFDLSADPHEEHNLALDPSHAERRMELEKSLIQEDQALSLLTKEPSKKALGR